jgi:IS1 family transposase
LSLEDRTRVVSALVEGNSIRSTVRMTGVAKNTVAKLLADLGRACACHHERRMRNLSCRRVQVDEIWSFVYAKQKNLPDAKRGIPGFGDVWTFVAIDAETKLVPAWMLGSRDAGTATAFMNDLAGRLAHRVQLTTDGHAANLEAIEDAFGGEIDYSQLVKIYGAERAGEARYSPAVCIGAKKHRVEGSPDPKHVSTSFVERQNLTMRMGMRRFTRLMNAFSKKLEMLGHAVAFHFTYYNFVRRHQTLRISPAMEAGVSDRLWSVSDLVSLLETEETGN